ncbi:MAG: Fe-S cluster assembly protein SufD [Chthoniobacteraceae bacterium]|nr:Fe-S cluster assembly protein SufD [Chthoniobacteraceae bacterium]
MSTLLFTDEAARAAARQQFDALPMPGRTDETWRFANFKALDLTPFAETSAPFNGDRDRLLKGSAGLAEAAGKMVFANDTLLSREILSKELAQKGVIWEPLEVAATAHPELFDKHFMAHGAPLGSAKFAALHAARVQTGTFLYVPAGVEINLPIEVFHWLSGENNATFPHTLLIAGERSKVTLVDYFQGAEPDTAGLAVGFNDLYAGPGAHVDYVCVQNWNRATLAIQVNNTVVGRDAAVKSLNVNLGGRYARTESASRLTGEGGRSDMLAVTAAAGSQEFDQRTFQDHLAPGAFSDLLYKNALDGASRTIFAGMIKVEQGAHRTDAYQKVRNLLLSDDAEANSMPGLEILADEVRCSHGATSGQIEAEELFYLLARGIPHETAQRLIVHGFLQEAIDRLGNTALGARLGELVQAKFLG